MFKFLGVNVDVDDVRAARLRRLASQQPNTSAESSTTIPRTESSQLKNEAVVSSNTKTVRRRLNDKHEEPKDNTNETETNKRLGVSRLLNTSTEKTERTLNSIKTAACVTRATSSETCPVTTSTGVTSLTSDQRMVAENVGMASTQEELLKSPLLRTPGMDDQPINMLGMFCWISI